MEYLLRELEENYEAVLKVLKTATSIRTASDKVLMDFESPSGITEATKQGRAARGQRFYDNYVKGELNMGVTAAKVLDIARSYIGCKESDGSHKKIVDLYNSHKPIARGYALKYTDSWCDGFVSAVAIRAGAADLIGTECGCEEHVKIFKAKGIWIEDGKATPVPGDIIVYNWDDSTQPNDGYSDHIGYVEQVLSGMITTIEGNYQDSVKRRTIRVGHGNIRGYARPKYAAENTATGGNYMFSVGDVKKESQGNDVKLLQRLLKSNGCKGKDGKPLKLDGDCGDNTVYAIKTYQKKKGIKADGIAGENTWKSILLR